MLLVSDSVFNGTNTLFTFLNLIRDGIICLTFQHLLIDRLNRVQQFPFHQPTVQIMPLTF